MADNEVSAHYTLGDLSGRILAALSEAGANVDQLSVDDLAPIDAFHVRGRAATEELAQWASIEPGHRVLDVGSGLGGTSRYLASTTGCQVVGVDLTEEYCRVAEMLSDRVGLSDRTAFRHGSALELPFADHHFDVVWTEHVQMNIADKARFYGELARVLKPGGQLAFHDIFAGPDGGLELPVPWASHASISHLIQVEELRALLAHVGLTPVAWEDKTDTSLAFFRTVLERVHAKGWMPLGTHLLMGSDAATKIANLERNLAANRLRVVQALMATVGRRSNPRRSEDQG